MRRRSAFTLTEMLVAMALIVFMMSILAEVFDVATTTFRRVKAVADMNERLRSASGILRRYLSADHFEGKKRLSDPNFWINGPPQEGFFRIFQGSPGIDEGADQDGNHAFRSTDHVLHFAVKLRGNNPGDFFRANVPATSPLLSNTFNQLYPPDSRFQELGGSVFCSQWAEVAFFLQASGDSTSNVLNTAEPQLSLFTLFLRQKVAIPDSDVLNRINAATPFPAGTFPVPNALSTQYLESSFYNDGTNLQFNSPQDFTMPARRVGGGGALSGATSTNSYQSMSQETGAQNGNDILLTNVLSFDVRVLLDGTSTFQALNSLGFPQNSPAGTYTPAGAFVFDTWSSRGDSVFDYTGWATANTTSSIPMFTNASGTPIRIRAIQVTIRIWDPQTQQSRQSSVIVDL